jgi:pyocin large subunit-like protein
MRSLRLLTGLLMAVLLLLADGPGFRSRRTFDEHYQKHGREFGNISQPEYLRLAQALRDAPAGGPILEAAKPGGVVTRFDRRSGAFGAYNSDRTIRTFFIPNDGERYFRRQALRPND